LLFSLFRLLLGQSEDAVQALECALLHQPHQQLPKLHLGSRAGVDNVKRGGIYCVEVFVVIDVLCRVLSVTHVVFKDRETKILTIGVGSRCKDEVKSGDFSPY
jgi:hypothetical protein